MGVRRSSRLGSANSASAAADSLDAGFAAAHLSGAGLDGTAPAPTVATARTISSGGLKRERDANRKSTQAAADGTEKDGGGGVADGRAGRSRGTGRGARKTPRPTGSGLTRDDGEADVPPKSKPKGSKLAGGEGGPKTARKRAENPKNVVPEAKSGTGSRVKKAKKAISGTPEQVLPEWMALVNQRREQHPSVRIGAHVSAAGGPASAVVRAAEMGATAFAFFPRPHRAWNSKPLEDDEAERFRALMEHCGYDPHAAVPHGSYLINCGSPQAELRRKSLDCLVEEVSRCERLGVAYYNFHPGAATENATAEQSLQLIADAINHALERTKRVTLLVETMCGQGVTVGHKFEQLQLIIKGVKDQSRIGVCLDTCHVFAAGYNIASESGFEEMLAELDRVVGLDKLLAIHLNDSKGELGSATDRHEKLGHGRIGAETFRWIMNDRRLSKVPMILETPAEDRLDRRSEHADELDMLYTLLETRT